MPLKSWVSIAEGVRLAQGELSRWTLWRLAAAKAIPSKRVGTRWRVHAGALMSYLHEPRVNRHCTLLYTKSLYKKPNKQGALHVTRLPGPPSAERVGGKGRARGAGAGSVSPANDSGDRAHTPRSQRRPI